MSSVPYGPIKKLLGFLQNNYRGRLTVMYNVNTPTFITIPWKMAKAFLEESTVKKINFIKKQVPEPLFQLARREQVEEKYGGTAPNLTKFWPPVIPSENYFLNNEDEKALISKTEYKVRYKQGMLKNLKIYKPFVEDDIQRPFQGQNQSQTSTQAQSLITSPLKMNERSSSKDFNLPPMKDLGTLGAAKNGGKEMLFINSARDNSTKIESSPVIRSKSQEIILEEEDYDEIMDEKANVFTREEKIRHFKAYFLQRLEF